MNRPDLGIAYFGNRYPNHARADLAEMAALGTTTVVHTCSEADLRWNPGTMAELVSIGNELGLTAWFTPWALGGIFGGEASSYAVMEHPEATQRDNLGQPLPALCLDQEPLRALIRRWLDCAAAAGVTVVTWDEPHLALPNPKSPDDRWSCRCGHCQARFAQRFGHPMPAVWTDEVADFQHDTTMRALEWMIAEATARGLESGLVLLPDEAIGDRGWRALASLPGVTWFGLTPYWVFEQVPSENVEPWLQQWLERMQAAIDGLPVRSVGWIQAFAIPAGREAELARGIEIMDELDIDMVAVWAFRACAAMSELAPADPLKVWTTIETAVRARAAGVNG
ncbi:MAG: hypothetical protein M9947_09065 [Thermomicrobiales bacterium]|nr:hypothetical protein [Thermomicrobiales bacterium]